MFAIEIGRNKGRFLPIYVLIPTYYLNLTH